MFFASTSGREPLIYSITLDGMSTSPAYASLDKVGNTKTLTGIIGRKGGTRILESIYVTDNGALSPILRVMFFKADPGGTDNADLAMSDSELETDFIGETTINSWRTQTSNRYAIASGLALPIQAASTTSDIFMVIQATHAWTASSTSEFVFKLGFL
jgi:hypothetical protein